MSWLLWWELRRPAPRSACRAVPIIVSAAQKQLLPLHQALPLLQQQCVGLHGAHVAMGNARRSWSCCGASALLIWHRARCMPPCWTKEYMCVRGQRCIVCCDKRVKVSDDVMCHAARAIPSLNCSPRGRSSCGVGTLPSSRGQGRGRTSICL
jgi:hypothetical protein